MLTDIKSKSPLHLCNEAATVLFSGSDLQISLKNFYAVITREYGISSLNFCLKDFADDQFFRFVVSVDDQNFNKDNAVLKEISVPADGLEDRIQAETDEDFYMISDELLLNTFHLNLSSGRRCLVSPVKSGCNIAGIAVITLKNQSRDEVPPELKNLALILNFTGLFLQRELSGIHRPESIYNVRGGEGGSRGISESFIDELFNDNSLPLMLLSVPDLKIIRYNPAAGRISDELPEELSLRSFIELIDSASASVIEEFLNDDEKRLLLLKNAALVFSDGKRITAELELRKSQNSAHMYILAALIPHTFKDQLVVANLESESRFASLRNVIPDLLLIMDKEGVYLDYFAPKDFPLIAAPDNFLGKNYKEVIQEPLLSKLEIQISELLSTGTEKFFEYSLEIHGKPYFFELRCVLMSDGNVLSLVRDISRVKQAESEKELLESRLRLILENFHGGLAILLNNGLEIEFAMGKELKELKLNEKELTGRNVFTFLKSGNSEVHQINFERAVKGEYVSYIEQLGDRNYIFSIIPVDKPLGQSGHYVFLLQNVSELLETQEKLKISEGLYRLLAENSKDIISLHEIDGTYVFVSPSAESVTGFSPDELTGKNITSIINPENLEKTRQIFDNMHEMIMLPQFTIEYQIKVKSGAVKWIESVISFLREEGRSPRYLAVSRNITERRNIEDKLRESESRYRYLVETMSEIIVRLDLSGNILFLNHAWRELTGYSVKGSEGKHFSDFTLNEDYSLITDFTDNSRSSGIETQNFELRLKSIRKGLRYFNAQITLTRNNAEKRTEILMTLTDITERKKTLEELKQSQQQLSSFLNSMNDVVYSIDLAEKRFLLLNKAAEIMYEKPIDQLLGNPDFYRDAVFASDQNTLRESEEKLYADGKLTSEYRIRTDEGNVKWIQDKVWIVKNDLGLPVRIEGIASDITERKRMEHGILRSLEKEKELNELKTNFIATASHEFRTPLATILTSLGLLEHYVNAEQPEKINSHLLKMKNSVNLIKQLLDDLIVINRNQSGYVKLKLEHFSVTDIIHDTVSLITDDEEEKKLFITENFLDNPVIKSDIKLFQHIMRNLIGNAYKYSGYRKPVNIKMTEDEDNWIFEISDKGIGIPEEDLPRIFDHFVRGRNVGTIPGTGLGLQIVKLSVDALKGEIAVSSKPGEGTKFTVSIPKVIFV